MALNLKLADAYVDLSLRTQQFDSEYAKLMSQLKSVPTLRVGVNVDATQFRRQMVGVRAELARLQRYSIQLKLDRGSATANLGLLRQQLQALKSLGGANIPIRADLRQWNRAIVRIYLDLQRVKNAANIPIQTNTSGAHSNLNLLLQHLKALQAQSKFTFTGTKAGWWPSGRGGGGGGGGMGGPGFTSGLWSGAGMGFAANPQMMAGEMISKTAIASAKTASEIQAKMADIQRVSGLKAPQMASVKQGVFDISTQQAGVSVDDVLDIASTGGRMGVADKGGAQGLLDFTRQVAMVKNAITDIGTEELANRMGRVLNVFELGTDRVAAFGSALTAMDNASTASASDILDITSRLAGEARAVNLTLPQVVALASVLKDVGASNEVAGTAMSQIFAKMATKSSEFAEKIGVDAKKFADAFRTDPMQALGMVIGKFKEMSDTIEGQEFLDELGLKGVRTAGTLQQLATKFDDVIKRTKIASEETGTLNALIAANNLKSDLAEASFQKFKNAATELADTIGQFLLPALTSTTQGLTGILKAASSGNWEIIRKLLQTQFGGMDKEGVDQTYSEITTWFQKQLYGSPEDQNKQIKQLQEKGALPEKNPNPVIPQPKIDPKEFHDAQAAWFGGIGKSIQGRVQAAQGAFGMFGNVAQAKFRQLGPAVRGMSKAAQDPAKVAERLADVDRREKEYVENFAKRAVMPALRPEFMKRVGQEPTDKDEKNRPLFAAAMQQAHDNMQRFKSEREAIQWAAGTPENHRAASVGSNNMMDIGRRAQEDILNSKQDTGKEQVKKLDEVVKILGEIKEAGGKGIIGAIGAVLAK